MKNTFQNKFKLPLDKETIYHYLLARPMARIPNHTFIVDEDLCYGCAACIALCPINIIELKERIVIVEEEKCTHCELCIPSCPVFALSIKPTGVKIID